MVQFSERRVAANPRLYDADSEKPVLIGVRCSRCERVYFPPIGIGCESCGAPEEALRIARLSARGTVFAVARVHHPGDGAIPFTIAEIELDDGPLIRAMIDPEAAGVGIGCRVDGIWHVTTTDDSGTRTVEPTFTPAADGLPL